MFTASDIGVFRLTAEERYANTPKEVTFIL